MRPVPLVRLLLCLALPLPAVAGAQVPAPDRPCESAGHRAFDFWIGDWEVSDPSGTVVGHNRIDRMLKGCVLHESWTGAAGMRGESFNLYDAASGRWHQTWVDDTGRLLLLDGGARDGGMVLEGRTAESDGAEVLNRIRWTPLADGRVRQHWQQSGDGGIAWTTVFDGYYRRAGAAGDRPDPWRPRDEAPR